MDCNKEAPSKRTLDRDIPELKDFLRPGITVLDIGCGCGTITLDIAAAVSPGEVVGIDPSEKDLNIAREWQAQHPNIQNLSFQVGDSHSLRFPNDTFDVIYSHTALHFFFDPVRALKEQKRVAKKGGWVIASGVRDHLISARYPACPHWDQVVQALSRYHESHLERLRSIGDEPTSHLKRMIEDNPTAMVHYHLSAGKKCPYWFSQAGLEALQIKVKAERVQYPGAEYMEHSAWDLLPPREAESDIERQLALWQDGMITEGFLDGETLARAQEEAEAWYKDPQAFNYWILVFAAGRA